MWKGNPADRGIRDSGGARGNPSHNVTIVNNIICGAIDRLPDGKNIDIRYNIFSFNNPTGIVPGEGNITLDVPSNFFVNAAIGDLRLKERSRQALGKGIPLAEVKIDLFGTPRGINPDLGAHQLTN